MDWRTKAHTLHVRWRTMCASAALTAIGVADVLGAIDVKPLVGYFVSDEKALGAVMTALPLVFAYLRVITREPLLTATPHEVAEAKASVDAGT